MNTAIISAVIGGLAGGCLGWISSYAENLRHRRFSETDDLKRKLYDYLELSLNYWLAEDRSDVDRRILEVRMIASQKIIWTDYQLLAKKYRHLRKSYEETGKTRRDLLDAATGGCFQQKEWKADEGRTLRIAKAVIRIVNSFY